MTELSPTGILVGFDPKKLDYLKACAATVKRLHVVDSMTGRFETDYPILLEAITELRNTYPILLDTKDFMWVGYAERVFIDMENLDNYMKTVLTWVRHVNFMGSMELRFPTRAELDRFLVEFMNIVSGRNYKIETKDNTIVVGNLYLYNNNLVLGRNF